MHTCRQIRQPPTHNGKDTTRLLHYQGCMVSGYDQPASPKHITHNMDKATMQSELVDNLAK